MEAFGQSGKKEIFQHFVLEKKVFRPYSSLRLDFEWKRRNINNTDASSLSDQRLTRLSKSHTGIEIARDACKLRHLVFERNELENGQPRRGGQPAGIQHDGRGRVRLRDALPGWGRIDRGVNQSSVERARHCFKTSKSWGK